MFRETAVPQPCADPHSSGQLQLITCTTQHIKCILEDTDASLYFGIKNLPLSEKCGGGGGKVFIFLTRSVPAALAP